MRSCIMMGFLLLLAQSQQLVFRHSCQFRQMSANQILKYCHRAGKCMHFVTSCWLTCVSELASEAANSVSVVSSTVRRFSITTSQLLAFPYRPLAMMIRCFTVLCGDVSDLLGSSCIIAKLAWTLNHRSATACRLRQTLLTKRAPRGLGQPSWQRGAST